MTHTSFLLWLVWALFAAAVVFVVGARYVRAVLTDPGPRPPGEPAGGPGGRLSASRSPGAPWLFCEDGAPLDKRAQWFRLRAGGATAVGNRPRAATSEAAYVYLNAHDLREQQVAIRYDRGLRRYLLEHTDGKVLHNNEPLPVGASVPLTDGDTIDLGDVTRLRFTFSGPPEEAR
jgi:hypothetical protein